MEKWKNLLKGLKKEIKVTQEKEKMWKKKKLPKHTLCRLKQTTTKAMGPCRQGGASWKYGLKKGPPERRLWHR